jgi:hypothetical protein
MNRRKFLLGAGAMTLAPASAIANNHPSGLVGRIAALEREMIAQRSGGKSVTSAWIVQRLGTDLTERDRRIAAFTLVRNIPYRLTAWTGDPDSLFVNERGDCRHKSAALLRLMRAWRFDAEPVRVLFDWADLPIPKAVLQALAETRGFHDTVEVRINGRMVLVDPTWDSVLAKAGFPYLANWDGVQPTPAVTPRADVIVRRRDFKPGTDLYAHFGIQWPQRERTLAFNRAFNAWTDGLRASPGANNG